MTNFEVVYEYGPNNDMILISNVYAINQNNFLVVDGWGKFRWVPMAACTLKWMWEEDHQCSLDDIGEELPNDEPAWDSYERLVREDRDA